MSPGIKPGGVLDILFVNAGIGRFAPIEQVHEAHFDEQFSVNVKGLYFTVQQLLPLIKPGGSIILDTSVVREIGVGTSPQSRPLVIHSVETGMASFLKTGQYKTYRSTSIGYSTE